MNFHFRHLSPRLQGLAGFGFALILLHWWVVPAISAETGATWLWALNPSRSFPLWFRIAFPLALLSLILWNLRENSSSCCIGCRMPGGLKAILALVVAGVCFWVLRVRTLELGDARLILDHFLSLNTYASVREPLESILHTEFARRLFYGWGVHPKTSFQIQSCLLGIFALGLCSWGILRAKEELLEFRGWMGWIFLIGPIHLFFGYIEWYTQLAAGLLIFEVFTLIHWSTGKGLWIALMGLIFACCSHLVGFALVPAALFLILLSRPGTGRWIESFVFVALLFASVGFTLWWIKSSIEFAASVEATSNLFTTLLPLMREDNPNNPPGSWHYSWLSPNHVADLVNEMVLCGLFSILILTAIGGKKGEDRKRVDPRMKGFFTLQLLACGTFVLIWNPWLGFPGDWDLFSFFGWPLLAFSLFLLSHLKDSNHRKRILCIAGAPAFSVVFAWVLHYHHPVWMTFGEARALATGTLSDLRLEEAVQAKQKRDWKTAFEKADAVLKETPHRRTEAFSLFNASTLQRMSEDWGDLNSVMPLAVDFEIMSASPMTRFLVMDCWGRLFFQEGGYFNDWSIHGLPDIPGHRAVDFEIVPWRRAAIILRDDGNLYEVPVSSWVNPNPSTPRETVFQDSSPDREPKCIGNFYTDFCSTRLGRGQRAVDLALDFWNERMVVLDTTGNLVADGTGTDFAVTRKAALTRCDVEMNYNGEFAFVVDHFGLVTSWPGEGSSIQVIHQIGWPAITDLELTRGGNDVYLLDGQGGVVSFSRLENALIDTAKMRHFFPTGEPLSMAPYIPNPVRYFIDLEIVPNQKAFYKMTSNFRIHYSEQVEDRVP